MSLATNVPMLLTIDLTDDDDPDSLGVEIWQKNDGTVIDITDDVGPSASNGPSHPLNDVAGPSSSHGSPMDFEFESEAYMKFLQNLQDEFNKEDLNNQAHFSQVTETMPPFSTVSKNQNNGLLAQNNRANKIAVASSSKMNGDANNNKAGTSKPNTQINQSGFPVVEMIETAPTTHKYFHSNFTPTKKNFLVCVNKDRAMLQNDLPLGIYVKMFENRLDLMSALIEGPKDSPYEGCLFMFDIQLSNDHPNKPPKVHYWAFCNEKLNPNLYTTGMVCLSLLGTWTGSSIERWTVKSTIFQLLISIQGLILVEEPYYNEPAFHKFKGTRINASKQYNNRTVNLVIESMTRQIQKPPEIFKHHVLTHYRNTGLDTYHRLEGYLPKSSKSAKKSKPEPPKFLFDAEAAGSQMETLLNSFYTSLIKLQNEPNM